MKSILLDISQKIDTAYVHPLIEIKKEADALNIDFFIIGACARDLIFEYLYGIKSLRKTNDIDLGIKVATWGKFIKLMSALGGTKKFTQTRAQQRIKYNDIFIDIVPFGKIAGSTFTITWPSENDMVMNTLGFEEVFKHSIPVRLCNKPVLDVRISSPPGLTLLKLLSWKDAYPRRKKDAQDVFFIMNNYENEEVVKRMYHTNNPLIKEEDFDIKNACIKLLGKDMAKICATHTYHALRQILFDETHEKSQFNLVIDMMARYDTFEETLRMLVKLKEGFFMSR